MVTGPLPATASFPSFASVEAPASGDKSTNGGTPKVAWSQSGTTNAGIIRGYRNNLTAFPSQTLTTANNADWVV